jgi:hypothetical protein
MNRPHKQPAEQAGGRTSSWHYQCSFLWQVRCRKCVDRPGSGKKQKNKEAGVEAARKRQKAGSPKDTKTNFDDSLL